jgi:D-amino-acid dehydrogenase
LKRTGALTVYASDRQFAGDEAEWKVKAANGIALVKLSGRDVREMEPALSQDVKHGVLAPDWSLIGDPKRLVDKMRENVVARGARLVVATVGAIRSSATGTPIVDIENGQQLEADNVVVAAGVWSGALAANIGDKVLMESERGYNVTLPASGINLQREIIFAESKFVASPLDCGLRIGGSAEFGGVDAAPNYKRSWNLLRLAQKFLPNLGVDGAIPWAGHRSTTPDSLPVIGRSLRIPSVLYSFGHGHLGLTQAATNARLVADMIHDRPAVLDLAPFSVKRFN